MPARTASSTTYWMAGLSTTGSISLGWALVAGRKRVPSPAAGITALVTTVSWEHCTTAARPCLKLPSGIARRAFGTRCRGSNRCPHRRAGARRTDAVCWHSLRRVLRPHRRSATAPPDRAPIPRRPMSCPPTSTAARTAATSSRWSSRSPTTRSTTCPSCGGTAAQEVRQRRASPSRAAASTRTTAARARPPPPPLPATAPTRSPGRGRTAPTARRATARRAPRRARDRRARRRAPRPARPTARDRPSRRRHRLVELVRLVGLVVGQLRLGHEDVPPRPDDGDDTADIGVFGGSGFYALPRRRHRGHGRHALRPARRPRSTSGTLGERRVAFLPRHGADHVFPPHRINYRANVWAMQELGVSRIFGPCASGSLQPDVKPGEFVVCDQLVDRTCGRSRHLLRRPRRQPRVLRRPLLLRAAGRGHRRRRARASPCTTAGTVVVIQGPRFSTRAESAGTAGRVGGHQHDPVPRGLPRPRAGPLLRRHRPHHRLRRRGRGRSPASSPSPRTRSSPSSRPTSTGSAGCCSGPSRPCPPNGPAPAPTARTAWCPPAAAGLTIPDR